MQKVKASLLLSGDIVHFGNYDYKILKTEKTVKSTWTKISLTLESLETKVEIGTFGFRMDDEIDLVESIAKTHNHRRTKIFV